ncbi:hypothetical protein [Herbaspirillum huttiense]|uniref:Uncharacterized protein n=2 Tax=Herbaspirillum huttiense TaxID=863372 RepID=A0AAJ2H4A1_9BURK|nr:hypothetical protein [Herbaspirillum huttiense]MDR9836407.1 hypothetical protein [Herbaspirillum huttiense]
MELVSDMHTSWSIYKMGVFNEMLSEHPQAKQDQKLFSDLVAKYSLGDWGWNWLDKAIHLNHDEYVWIFLVAEEKVQAASIIYHPKTSRFDGEKIFYIDYLATANWNRPRPNFSKQFSTLGTKLIAFSIDYAMNTLGYRPGFSLHSLPDAESFYSKLGMTAFEKDREKENLMYFEADVEASQNILGLVQ